VSLTSATLARYGRWLANHGAAVRAMQWFVVAIYAMLVVVPAFLPLPDDGARALDNLTVFAQWAFWGLWWPFVILSMFAAGRTWCGVFCPEGTLTEAASRFGLHRSPPRWLRWAGWPFVAFAVTTVYGQLVSVYQYPKAVLLVLGGSTIAAIATGFVYGREKRVWCRYLCPVNGVFNVLARMAPVHFRVDRERWAANAGHIAIHPVNCAPMVRIRRMTGNAECHACGRCAGHLDAVTVASRSPNAEVLDERTEVSVWDAMLIVVGAIGIAIGAFQWSASPWFVRAKLEATELIVDHGPAWLLSDTAPWWLMTHYPEANDVFTWLDGALIVGWIVATALIVGGWVSVWLAAAARSIGGAWRANAYALAYTLIPLAGVGLFVGLSGLPAALAHGEGLRLSWLAPARAVLLAAAAAWSMYLAYRWVDGRSRRGEEERLSPSRRIAALLAMTIANAGVLAAWYPYVFR